MGLPSFGGSFTNSPGRLRFVFKVIWKNLVLSVLELNGFDFPLFCFARLRLISNRQYDRCTHPRASPQAASLLTGQGGGRHCLLLEVFVKEVGGGEDRGTQHTVLIQ